jgi:PQQ-dependent catabolism-associated CXXCW motif protein
MERYRAPVPADVPGGQTIDVDQARSLLNQRAAVFIDVYPPRGLGPDPLDGHWVISETRESLPGAIWLPEVGRGHLEPDAQEYFERNLKRLSGNKKNAALVFYCTADCWQSWNAAKRAIALGYSNVHWYPLGSDGWREQGHKLEIVQPVNFIDHTLPGLVQNETHQAEKPLTEMAAFPASANVFLVDQQGAELAIGTVTFSASDTAATGVLFELDEQKFEDHFLSMRPFRCLTQSSEWFCYLPYPYEIARTVNADNLTDLEYQLLFIWKSPKTFGIDAWNGVYYKLTAQNDGSFTGQLLQGDLNVLADPPEPMSYPIDLQEFTEEDAKRRRFPTLIIKP